MDKTLLAIYGPTTSNKLGTALTVSKYIFGRYHLDSELINCDPRKIYSGFTISQSLPHSSITDRMNIHLFGSIPPHEMLTPKEINSLTTTTIHAVWSRKNLPILIGGSYIHMASVIYSWNEKGKDGEPLSKNTLILGVNPPAKTVGDAISRNVKQMFQAGLYAEFCQLYEKSQSGKVSRKLLEETIGYREFIEMGTISNKDPLTLDKRNQSKVESWIIKDIKGYARRQRLDLKRFRNIKVIRNDASLKRALDKYLQE